MAWQTARSGVVVEESPVATPPANNRIHVASFTSAPLGLPPPKPWKCSQSTEKAHVTVETPPGRPETERWAHLVDGSDQDNANLRQSFAPVTSGRFQVRLISNKEGGRLFFNLGSGAASKPEERALQLEIDNEGALVIRGGEHSHKTSSRIRIGEAYLVRCDFERATAGKALGVQAELVGESTQLVSHVEAEMDASLPISALRVTSTRADTGVDYYVTDVSLTGR